MTKVKKFEDVIAWQKARELVKMVYEMTRGDDFAKDFSLKDQFRRAAVSVMSNIAEGFSRQTDREFIQFLYIAKGSVSEMQSQLYVALDLGYIEAKVFDKAYGLSSEVAKVLTGFIRYLQVGSASD
jgi:four helix bundle protein